MEPDQFERLLAEVGETHDAISEIARIEDDRWVIVVEDVEVNIDLDLDLDLQRVRLGTQIGVPPPSRAGAVYRGLLAYNSAGRMTADVVMALSEPEGSILQMTWLPLAGLTAAAIADVAVNLAERTPQWQAVILGEPDDEEGSSAERQQSESEAIMIRV